MFRISDKNPPGFNETYCFDITRYYRVWFSKNPDIFLGIENELRFIRMRQENPTAKLAFVYSSKCLNEKALANLKKFCHQHKITPIDFDSQIGAWLQDENDKQLYAIAQQEIQRTLQKKHGNLAAASDCVRLIIPVIEKLGIYTDFDVKCTLSTLNYEFIQIKAPVLMNAEMIGLQNIILNPNTDFLAFSYNLDKPNQLSKEAIQAVKFVQQEVIAAYTYPFTSASVLKNVKPEDFKAYPGLSKVFKDFSETKPAEGKALNVFDFRKFVSALSPSKKDDVEFKRLNVFLSRISVVNVSGPGIYFLLYKQLFPKNVSYAPPIIPCDKNWHPYLSLFRKSSIGYYDPIADRFESKNSAIEASKQTQFPQPGTLSDLSWLPEGEVCKKQREDKIVHAAKSSQRFWLRKNPRFLVKHYDAVPQYDECEFKSLKKN